MSQTRVTVNFEVFNNEDWKDSFLLGTVETPFPLVDGELHSTLRASIDGEPILNLSSSGGTLEISDPEGGRFQYAVPKAIIIEALAPGTYLHDLVFVGLAGDVKRIYGGKVKVTTGPTREIEN